MNEIIEKYFQRAMEDDILCTEEIDKDWRKAASLTKEPESTAACDSIDNLIRNIWWGSAKKGFELGFRTALRFLMDL
ncbi:MAG: hypothetical protein IJ496_01740 [Ruminococcus sp.]|nr:hypothetical protein [Ruminococcus sp.]